MGRFGSFLARCRSFQVVVGRFGSFQVVPRFSKYLTGTDYCNSKLSNKKYIYLLLSIFQKNLEGNHSPSVVFWKDFVFTLKVVCGKLL